MNSDYYIEIERLIKSNEVNKRVRKIKDNSRPSRLSGILGDY